MNATARLACCVLLSVLTAGCAGFDLADTEGKAVSEKLKQRNEEVTTALESKRAAAEFQAALARFSQGDAAGCEQDLTQLLRRNPGYRDARLLAVEVCLTDNRVGEALKHAQHAMEAHPDDPHVSYTMGLVLDAAGQEAGAAAYYQRAAELDPESELFTMAHLTVLEAAEQAPVGRVSNPSANSVLENPSPERRIENPSYDESASKGHATAESAGYATAAASESETPANRPENSGRNGPVDSGGPILAEPVQTSLQRANQELERGSPEAAAFFFREAIATSPNDPQIPISAGVAALRYNQPGVAVDLLLPARHRFVRCAEIYRVLGTAYYRLGDYQSSQVALRQALSLDKTSGLTYFLMGCTLAKLGQHDAAQDHLKQARTLNPRYGLRR
ncbi:MAG: tetratricopeptide repeat protein [Candidatus Nealsonbacteria bacterium]|nr:tetratricopeptide repeat protein [Candidatus Nealsonbacteria bacterium]